MELILILGPMKSGKSFELISNFAPLKYTKINFGLFQSSRNVRDNGISSRNGISLNAQKVQSLSEIMDKDLQVVGIDEVHMFEECEAENIKKLMQKGVRLVISGLDMDCYGQMFPIVKKILELGPKEVRYKRAVCEVCGQPTAVYTQILNNGEAVLTGLPSVVPDDGTYTYKPMCACCFKKV
jgi:thymidine kinase